MCKELSCVDIVKQLKADSVDLVKSQGKVKNYKISFRFNHSDNYMVNQLENLWPFSTISVDKDGTTLAEYLVRPSEMKEFKLKITEFKKRTQLKANLHVLPRTAND
ncbi:hypothetical protein JOC37_001313 [Desulfohalotomaculum tongense]|uniref:hypothetical protein n=1 Tax=Desulforadius tongensis TaxID=1216062 RepID=UPI00195AAE97|nr:hypothetical protein [Desulforadius tongensis]MBM7854933.1 hypothetical protein [Desulforadius tongensis]